MAIIDITVPDIGDFSDVPVVGVLVAPGDEVAEEAPLIELESDKATMEVPAPSAGTIVELKVKEGDTVSEGALIMTLESQETRAPVDPPSPEGVQEHEPVPPSPAVGAPASGSGALTKVDETGFRAVHASPSVRALARELGVDLASVKGTGRKGRIIRSDVTSAAKASPKDGAAMAGGAIPPVPTVDFARYGPVETVEMSRIKKISGPSLHRSWLNIPHVTHREEADITDLEPYRRALDTKARDEGYRVTLLAFAIKATVCALKNHWEVNASLHPDGDKLIRKSYYHIAFAADTPHGLVVPVIRDADQKGIIDISGELGDLSARARAGKLKGSDMQGATFTISSLGGIGGHSFTPIINAPEVAILGMTRSRMVPVWDREQEQFVPRLMQPLCLSYDHRAIDGALAARFCADLARYLGDIRNILL
ncbi:MAG: 2-oxo acid dehydrogenase subunit E2 [Rhodobacteraceae bacterium]|nr:2-oxo acid dehydrogenase subunit E2 [Paracoccaceae bacterium]